MPLNQNQECVNRILIIFSTDIVLKYILIWLLQKIEHIKDHGVSWHFERKNWQLKNIEHINRQLARNYDLKPLLKTLLIVVLRLILIQKIHTQTFSFINGNCITGNNIWILHLNGLCAFYLSQWIIFRWILLNFRLIYVQFWAQHHS